MHLWRVGWGLEVWKNHLPSAAGQDSDAPSPQCGMDGGWGRKEAQARGPTVCPQG